VQGLRRGEEKKKKERKGREEGRKKNTSRSLDSTLSVWAVSVGDGEQVSTR
jgi:hypothetical protein